MGEIDTKPIEPVQVAVTFFGEKSDQKKHCHGSSSSDEIDKEKDIEGLQKDLANYKVQMEAKDAAYLQLLHKLEHYQKTAEELSVLLKNSDVQRDIYFQECREAKFRVNELEAKVKEMADQVLETGKIREQLSHVLGELKAVQGEVLSLETELAVAIEEKLKALAQAKEDVETAENMEKEVAEELLMKRVGKLNRTISMPKQSSFKEEKEMESATEIEVQDLRNQQKTIQELEIQLLSKSVFIESLQVELNQANELLSSSDKVVSNVIEDMNKLQEELKVKEKENSDQATYIGEMESEMNQLKLELKNVKILTDELEKAKIEMEEIKERENEAQVEIALLKASLHKERSRLAAAEAAEARAGNILSGLYLDVEELAVETEEFKNKNQRLKQASDEYDQTNESIAESEKKRDENDPKITISLEEYESLIKKAEKANQSPRKDTNHEVKVSENKHEVESLKKELEAAVTKVSEFRTRAEQAATRAEAAEKAKLSLEDQLRKWREQKQRRKAALAALREESLSREFSYPSSYDNTPRNHQPLGKVLNIKF